MCSRENEWLTNQFFFLNKCAGIKSNHEAHLDKFESDFTLFLKFQLEGLKTGGHMILKFLDNDKYHTSILQSIGIVLNDMVSMVSSLYLTYRYKYNILNKIYLQKVSWI